MKDSRFFVRDFVYDAEKIDAERKEQKQLAFNIKEQWSSLLRQLRTSFSEMFSDLMHVKVLQLCADSILRYGLPPTYLGFIVKSQHKNAKKLRSALIRTMAACDLPRLNMSKKFGDLSLQDDTPFIMGLEEDYYPYSSFEFDLNFE